MDANACLTADLSSSEFEQITRIVKDLAGIRLHDGKESLVKARLNKRLRELGLTGYRQYIQLIGSEAGANEIPALLDAISTNLTSFYREPAHLDYLAERVLPAAAAQNQSPRRLRIWSAGCSSGEEPYSIAIKVREHIRDADSWDIRILATDISRRVLSVAKEGVYASDRIAAVPPMVRSRSFECIESKPKRLYRVVPAVKDMVYFARLNLMDPWAMKGPFDAIFCRNVMIYFDKDTQSALVRRFWDLLKCGGTLFVGHSESLTGTKHDFRYIQPTVYEK